VIVSIALTVVLLLPSLNSDVNAVIVNNTDFSVSVPNGWIYRENFGYPAFQSSIDDVIDRGDHITLTPNEFADYLVVDTATTPVAGELKNGGGLVDLVHDLSYPLKNAPVEIYVKQFLGSPIPNVSPKYENVTIDGEKAIKVYMRGTDAASNMIWLSYFVVHHGEPYHLDYIANVKDYEKYLPQFEQMVKTFKFVK
jgi:hypothetical protein